MSTARATTGITGERLKFEFDPYNLKVETAGSRLSKRPDPIYYMRVKLWQITNGEEVTTPHKTQLDLKKFSLLSRILEKDGYEFSDDILVSYGDKVRAIQVDKGIYKEVGGAWSYTEKKEKPNERS
jgi:hypothetical protein